MTNKSIYFAGGCFWGTEHFMKQINGVNETEVGYANGDSSMIDPTYKEVKTGNTGFAETVRVEYDADTVSLERLMELFFITIDPVSINQQGEDIGTQYRTGIYYTNDADRAAIEAFIAAKQATIEQKIAIEIDPLESFYSAEEYHQAYLDKNPEGYCHISTELFAFAKNQG